MSGETSLQLEPSGEGTTQPTSPMDVCDEEQDEAFLKLNEDELREMQKVNSIQCIQRMRFLQWRNPGFTFRFAEWCTCL
jgi:hypothetical protein